MVYAQSQLNLNKILFFQKYVSVEVQLRKAG